MTGGSAFGLGAADGVMRWLAERGQGRLTPSALVPHVPAAVVFDLVSADIAPPGPEAGYAACEAARPGAPQRGRVGAGAGAAVGKVRGREHATPGGVGFAALRIATGEMIAAVAVVNAFGDVVDADGRLLGAPRDEHGRLVRSVELIAGADAPPLQHATAQNTTLVCVCTDASIDKRSCAIVARTASAGIARAVDPAFTQADGDVLFCLASGAPPYREPGPESSWAMIAIGTAAASVTADAIRDAVRGQHSDS
jgi:L-aminopeptidase/D-esterase-like protein